MLSVPTAASHPRGRGRQGRPSQEGPIDDLAIATASSSPGWRANAWYQPATNEAELAALINYLQ
jgi:hypothetical protein